MLAGAAEGAGASDKSGAGDPLEKPARKRAAKEGARNTNVPTASDERYAPYSGPYRYFLAGSTCPGRSSWPGRVLGRGPKHGLWSRWVAASWATWRPEAFSPNQEGTVFFLENVSKME